MRALAVNHKTQKIGIIDLPEPYIAQPTQMRLRAIDVGVCSLDRDLSNLNAASLPPGSQHLILGHECLAQVVEVGTGVTSLQVGELVVPTIRRPCPHEGCRACRHESPEFCLTGDYVERGIKGAHGYMAEVLVVNSRFLVRVPKSLRSIGVLVTPLALTESAMAQVDQIEKRLPFSATHGELESFEETAKSRRRHRALILGAGPVGLLAAMLLRTRHYQTVVWSRHPTKGPKKEIVESIGASYVCSSEWDQKRPAEVFQLIIDATGGRASSRFMQVLGHNGVFLWLGTTQPDTQMSWPTGRHNQVFVCCEHGSMSGFKAAVKSLSMFKISWPEAVEQLISERVALSDAESVFANPKPELKQVIKMGRVAR